MSERLLEFRCPSCGKLLAKYRGHIEVKCPRCKSVQTTNTIECLHKEIDGDEGLSTQQRNAALR